YNNNYNDSIGPESKPLDEEKNKPPVKKDTIPKAVMKKEEPVITPIGSMVEETKKQKKERKKLEKQQNN
ncbi:MAG: hypothetical protein SGI83_15830, partial [Bacteroidota bacterium]|nr:hypothetical protein [Bacteroidota bacterium]